MFYNYKAVSNKGDIVEGNCEGENLEEVLEVIRKNEYLPISIEEVRNKNRVFLEPKVKGRDISTFCQQFHTMLEAGIDVINCLDVLKKQTENKVLKKSIGQVYEEVQKGTTISETMGKHAKTFPTLLINMVQAGEVSGNLDGVLRRMAIYYEKENKIETRIKGAVVYPIILIIVSIFVVIFLLTTVLPTFIDIFESSGVALPIPTRILLRIGNGLKRYWYIYLILFSIFILAIKTYDKTQKGIIFFDRLKIQLPGIKKN